MVDTALFTIRDERLCLILARRQEPPFAGVLALPGGFVHVEEDADTAMAARRVIRHKVGFDAPYLEQLFTFSGPARDPRGWSVSVAYYALIPLSLLDQSQVAETWPAEALPPLPFDHSQIVAQAVERLRSKATYSSLPAFLLPSAASTGPVLAAQGIVKSFGGLRAVQEVDMTVADRTLHALIGPNGAGKTTAFNLLSGLYAPDKGQVALLGQSIAGLSPEAIAQAGIGRSFQITNLFPALDVEENIRLAVQARDPARFNPWRSAHDIPQVNERTREMLRYLGLAGMEKAEAGSLSYGGQRLLDIRRERRQQSGSASMRAQHSLCPLL
jgi:ADP-ribose pyrophosphatase YjhB (NUDIX family)/ABC-type lipoprotein export system ATPase subunit